MNRGVKLLACIQEVIGFNLGRGINLAGVFLKPSRQILEWLLKLSHNGFLPHSSQLAIHSHSTI